MAGSGVGGELLQAVHRLPQAQPLLNVLPPDPPVYLAGGAVRDLLRDQMPSELDLVVEGDSLALARRLGGRQRRHDRFGTVTVLAGEQRFDLARARRERYPHPGALPEVEPATLAEDLGRRDFTVNAMALRLNGRQAGQLVEAPGALADLHAGRLRVLHAGSFLDDPTRLLRLARYQARLQFRVEPVTADLALRAIAEGALLSVGGSRLGAELRLVAGEPDPVAAMRCLQELGVTTALDPALGLRDLQQAHLALGLLPESGHRDQLILGLACEPVPAGRRRALLERLDFPAAPRRVILAVAAQAGPAADALAQAAAPSQIAAIAASLSPEVVAAAGARGAQAQAQAWLAQLRHVRLEISGRDLLAAGVPAGPAVARGLQAALAARLDGHARGRESELDAALAAISGG